MHVVGAASVLRLCNLFTNIFSARLVRSCRYLTLDCRLRGPARRAVDVVYVLITSVQYLHTTKWAAQLNTM